MEDELDEVLDLENRPNALSADTDADGVADMLMGDETGDGRADWVVTRKADGTSVALIDTDESGSLETALVDSDAEGTFDAATRDLDDDGEIDVTQIDQDRDGVLETIVLADETIIQIDPTSGLVTDVTESGDDASGEPVGPFRDPSTGPRMPAAQPSDAATPVVPPTSVQPTTSSAPTTSAPNATPAPTSVQPTPSVSSSTPAPSESAVVDDVVPSQPATDASGQTPWAPDQPGIGDDVVPQPATDASGQTPWAPDQPGIGDDVVPSEPEVEPVSDLIHGDGDAEFQWGQIQTQNGYCGPVSMAMVLSELTGVRYDETQMVQAAIDRNMLVGQPGAWEGMYVQDVATMLTEFGAPSHVETGTLDSLRSYLDQGRDIILFVDSSEVWYGIDDDGTAGDRQDHFLVITEIDDERGVATLNDPGIASGVGREVSLTVIEDAWQDSGYEMVVTDSGVVYGRAAVDLGGEVGGATESHPHAGFVILPVVLTAAMLASRSSARPAQVRETDR